MRYPSKQCREGVEGRRPLKRVALLGSVRMQPKESRRKREYIMGRVGDSTHRIEASQDHDDKQKREERREKRGERRK